MVLLDFPFDMSKTYCPMCSWRLDREGVKYVSPGLDDECHEEHLRLTCQCGYAWRVITSQEQKKRNGESSAARASELERREKIERESKMLLRAFK